ncbi:MAG: hypothetical protein WA821_03410 [Anaerolineales bacterium]
MGTNPGLMIVIVGGIAIVVGAIIGYLVAILESRLTTALAEGRGELEPEQPDAPPPPKLDEHDVLKVTIDPALKWHVDLDGARVEPDGLTVEQRTRLVNVVVQIRPWIDGQTLAPVAPKISDPDVDSAAAALIVAEQPVTTPLRIDPLRGARDLLKNDLVKPEPPKITSIVSMIDEVLQKNLEGSPLAGKKIRLEEGTVGEVVVFVGSMRYSGIDAVPEDDIKAIIREAIAEWNKQ